jgi:hypothetical protein
MATQSKPSMKLHEGEKTEFYKLCNVSCNGKPYIKFNVNDEHGKSLFLSIICQLHSDLLHGNRNASGSPSDVQNITLENTLESHFKTALVNSLSDNVHYFDSLGDQMQPFLKKSTLV